MSAFRLSFCSLVRLAPQSTLQKVHILPAWTKLGPRHLHYRATTPLRFIDNFSSSSNTSQKAQDSAPSNSEAPASEKARTRPEQPEYEMTFTCRPCSARSTHRVSKQGYHHGSVLITCPSCKNRHIISDHLNVGSCCSSVRRRTSVAICTNSALLDFWRQVSDC